MKNLDTKAMAQEAHMWWVRRGEHLAKSAKQQAHLAEEQRKSKQVSVNERQLDELDESLTCEKTPSNSKCQSPHCPKHHQRLVVLGLGFHLSTLIHGVPGHKTGVMKRHCP
jgi:hypothetical protein